MFITGSWAVIQFVMKNKWAQDTLIVLAAIAGYLAWQQHQRSIGAEREKKAIVQQVVTDQGRSVDDKYAATATTLNNLQVQLASLQKQQEILGNIAVSLAQQRQQVPQQVQQLSAAQVAEQVAVILGSKPGEPLTLSQNRQVLQCFKEKELCDQELEVAHKETKKEEQQKQNVIQQYGTLSNFTVGLYQDYNTIFPLVSKPVKKWQCFWFCSKPRELKVHNPKDLVMPQLHVQEAPSK
jgi:hypothetical protein